MTLSKLKVKQLARNKSVRNCLFLLNTACILLLVLGCNKNGTTRTQRVQSNSSVSDEVAAYINRQVSRNLTQKCLDDTKYLTRETVLETVALRELDSIKKGITIQAEAVLIDRRVDYFASNRTSTVNELGKEYVTLIFSILFNTSKFSKNDLNRIFESSDSHHKLSRLVLCSAEDGSDVHLIPMPRIKPTTLNIEPDGSASLTTVSGNRSTEYKSISTDSDGVGVAVFAITMQVGFSNVQLGNKLEVSLSQSKMSRMLHRLNKSETIFEKHVHCVPRVLIVHDYQFTRIKNIPQLNIADWP